MRNEFNNLVELMNRYSLYHSTDEVGIALNELEQKIIEVEKRMECVKRTNIDINEIVFTNQVKLEETIGYDYVEILQRSVNDINIAMELTDSEPIENNWYSLFSEPKKEEPKVLIPKGSILVWDYSRKYYSAKGGAKAKVLEDYKEEDYYIKVEWLDERANNQENGGYERDMFKEEFELPKEEVAPTELCKIPQTYEFVKDIIAKLKVIDVDGETMQYILEQVGMTDQMLRQLIMSNPETDTKDLLEEKIELANK